MGDAKLGQRTSQANSNLRAKLPSKWKFLEASVDSHCIILLNSTVCLCVCFSFVCNKRLNLKTIYSQD